VLAMLALAVLSVLVADARHATPSPRDRRGVELLQLTTNEIRHLMNVLIIKPAQRLTHYLSWSGWRRAHQARARRLHLDLIHDPRLAPHPGRGRSSHLWCAKTVRSVLELEFRVRFNRIVGTR
jgi:hypothetical protein